MYQHLYLQLSYQKLNQRKWLYLNKNNVLLVSRPVLPNKILTNSWIEHQWFDSLFVSWNSY